MTLGNNSHRQMLQGRWKPLIFDRDNYIYRACGSNGSLELAHITPVEVMRDTYGYRGVEWSFAWDNLVTLCEECHNCYHRSKRGFNYNLKRWQDRKIKAVNSLFFKLKQNRNQKFWGRVGG